jgi:hypothetical protein
MKFRQFAQMASFWKTLMLHRLFVFTKRALAFILDIEQISSRREGRVHTGAVTSELVRV